MAMFSSDNSDVVCEMNVTPLVDVMLVLLVVFIVTAPLLTKSIPLNLPKTNAVAPTDQPDPIIVSIDAKGDFYIANKNLSLAELEQNVLEAFQANPRQGVQLRADESVKYAPVAQAMAAIQHSGVTRLVVVTK